MSGDAIDQARDAQFKAKHWEDSRRELTIVENQVATHGLALQIAGIIPMHTDSEWLTEAMSQIDLESLR